MKAVVVILSLSLNVALAWLVTQRLRPTTGPPRPVPSPAQLRVQSFASLPTTTTPTPTFFVTNRFQWRDLDTESYQHYVANLRAIGCPETTLRDIIEADLDRHYAILRGRVTLDAGFWACGKTRSAAERRQAETLSAMDAEKTALLVHLLGVEPAPRSPHLLDDLLEESILRFVMGPLPEGVPEQVFATMAADESQSDQIREHARGLLLPEDEDRLRQVHARTLERLQTLLGPAPFQEFQARIAAAQLFDGDLEYAHLSANELRTVAHLHADTFGFSDDPSWRLFERNGGSEEQQAAFELGLKQLLGDERYAAYQREKDADFRTLLSLTESQHLASDVAQRVYEIKQLAATEQDHLRQDQSIPPDHRAAQLVQMQAATLASVQVLLGDKGYQAYLVGGGAWLTNAFRP
jgi:hypothetical protein